jgi:hypothetical protein
MKKISFLIAMMFFAFYLLGQDDDWIDPSIILPWSGREQPYYINAIPYNDYSFDIQKKPTQCSILDILGWSRDGKVLIFSKGHSESTFSIVDIVEDTEIDIKKDFYKRYDTFFEYAEEDVIEKYIKEIAKKYNIESTVGALGEFPYVTSEGNEYGILVQEIEVENEHTRLDAYIYQKFSQNKKKLVNTFGNEYGWDDTERGKLKFWYAKSPFENRIAVIPTLPVWISGAYDIYIYFLKLYGSHLNVGFNLNM